MDPQRASKDPITPLEQGLKSAESIREARKYHMERVGQEHQSVVSRDCQRDVSTIYGNQHLTVATKNSVFSHPPYEKNITYTQCIFSGEVL